MSATDWLQDTCGSVVINNNYVHIVNIKMKSKCKDKGERLSYMRIFYRNADVFIYDIMIHTYLFIGVTTTEQSKCEAQINYLYILCGTGVECVSWDQ